VDDRRLLRLGDHDPAGVADRPRALDAVVAHPGEHHACALDPQLGVALEEAVGARNVAVGRGRAVDPELDLSGPVLERHALATGADDAVYARARHALAPGADGARAARDQVGVARRDRAARAALVEALREGARELVGHVL